MNIVITWDSSVSTMSPSDEAAFKAAVTYAVNYFDRVITSPQTVTINVGWGEITQGGTTTPLSGSVGEGGPSNAYNYTYAQVKSALQSHINSPATAAAYAALPSTDPTGGSGMYVPVEEAAALGLPSYSNTALGSVGFGTPAGFAPYNFSTTDRAVSGHVDFVGMVEHEIAHALGRVSNVGSSGLYIPDLFRFSSAGVLATTSSQTAYFSIDGGHTALKYFDSTNSDPSDWMSSGPNASSGDSFDAVNLVGQEAYVTAADLDLMNLLGYTITTNLPRADFLGDELTDSLIQNTSGAVVVAQIAPGGQESYTQVTALGSEWKFVGSADFLGDGLSDFLIENSAGAVDVAEVVGGHASFRQIGALGSEWKFVGVGDFLNDNKQGFLIENSSGAVVVGEVASGHASYTTIGALGSAWSFVGSGDFLGDGAAQFLIKNTNGALVIGSVSSGHAAYTTIGGLGAEWKVVETGDFLGDGKTDFLIENTSGAIYAGEVVSGHASFTSFTALGPEWSFVGAGDYYGTGTDSFLLRNTSGAVVVGTYASGHVQFTQVGALGHEWSFRG